MKSRNFSLSHLLIFLFLFFEKRRETEIVTDTDDDVVVRGAETLADGAVVRVVDLRSAVAGEKAQQRVAG